jgi:hypothetical protein
MRVSCEGAHGLLPNELTVPSSPSLLSRANLLFFGARLDEAVKAGPLTPNRVAAPVVITAGDSRMRKSQWLLVPAIWVVLSAAVEQVGSPTGTTASA